MLSYSNPYGPWFVSTENKAEVMEADVNCHKYILNSSYWLKLFPTNVIYWKHLQTVLIQIRPDTTSGLIWIQTVLHSDGEFEIIFWKKKLTLKKNSANNKKVQDSPVGKELENWKIGK